MNRQQKKLVLVSLVVLLIDCAATLPKEDYEITITSTCVGPDAGLPLASPPH